MTKNHTTAKYLYAGNKLKITLMMRGREMEYKDMVFVAVYSAVSELAHVGTADS